MGDFDYTLSGFRESEDHEAALQLLMDKALMRYCGLWRPTLLRRVHSYPLGDEWNDLWDCVEVDYKRLAELADEPEGRARFQINRLRELRLIYPDGTRTAWAKTIISKYLQDALK